MSVLSEHAKKGPFPGQIDPWAETGLYFQQIHAGMIDAILGQIQDPLIDIGYRAGRERSLQITEAREPDIFVWRKGGSPLVDMPTWDYTAAAQQIQVKPGIEVESPELHAIYITMQETGRLITVLEVVSPRNKSDEYTVSEYKARRQRLVASQGVNVVEIDPTRSIKHLLDVHETSVYAYHIAIHMPQRAARLIVSAFGEPLERFALPLRAEVLPVGAQDAYDYGYQHAAIALQIEDETGYAVSELPFPSLINPDQRRDSLERVAAWREELKRLRES